MISQGLVLATKGKIGSSAVAYSTFGKIWRRITQYISSAESAYTFVRSFFARSFIRIKTS